MMQVHQQRSETCIICIGSIRICDRCVPAHMAQALLVGPR